MNDVTRISLEATGILLGVIALAYVLERLVYGALLRLAQRNADSILAVLLQRAQPPVSFALPLLTAVLVVPDLPFHGGIKGYLIHALEIGTSIATAWAIVAAIQLYGDIVKRRIAINESNVLRSRQIETRINILSRTAITLVVLIAAALVAMTYPPIRTLGTTLLASAGVAGLAVGLAARPLFENLVAGVQIALTQPIRLDDVVIVQGEFGHVEEIAATYVVVRLWDRRRMVVPLTYFIQQPFENWTRTGTPLIGTVIVYTDYTVPVADVREELSRILARSSLWDGDVESVQVTDASESAMQLRVLVSASDAARLFDLRCEVREKLIDWLGRTYPEALPRTRFVPAAAGSAATPGE